VRHFAPTKAQGDLYLVTVVQKLENVAHLNVIVVVIRVWTELNFFDFDDLLLLTCLSFFFLSLVFELAVVHDLANRRVGIWRNFYQIEARFIGHDHRTFGCHNTYVFAFRTDKADFGGPNTVINAWACVALWWRVMWSASYGLYPLVVPFK